MPQVQTQFVGSDVTPGLSMDNAPTLTFANRESSSDFRDIATFPAGKHMTHCHDRWLAEFSLSGRASSCVVPVPANGRPDYLASLGYHVSHVVELGAKKKMVRVNTESNIARMAHVHPIRDGTSIHLKRYAMCKCESLCGPIPYKAVSTIVGTKPNPAAAFWDGYILFVERGAFH